MAYIRSREIVLSAVALERPEVQALQTADGQNNYTLEKDAKPDPVAKEPLWRFTSPDPKGRTADTTNVGEMLRLLGTTQSVTRFVNEQPTDAQPAKS